METPKQPSMHCKCWSPQSVDVEYYAEEEEKTLRTSPVLWVGSKLQGQQFIELCTGIFVN